MVAPLAVACPHCSQVGTLIRKPRGLMMRLRGVKQLYMCSNCNNGYCI